MLISRDPWPPGRPDTSPIIILHEKTNAVFKNERLIPSALIKQKPAPKLSVQTIPVSITSQIDRS